MTDQQILMDTLQFHGHKCWASTAGVRIGLTALAALGADRSGAMCFGDGVQYTTGCTFGKGNIEKNHKGKLTLTLIDKANQKAVRVAYKPTLQKQIKESAFMQKRAAGVPPTQIPQAEQMELVNLIWAAPQEQIMTIGPVVEYTWGEPAEIVRFAVCEGCGELVAEPYLRVVNGKSLCRDCSGYAV